MKLQYSNEDTVQEFIGKMNEVTTEAILCDESIVHLLSGSVPQQISNQENPLGLLECFLQLFIDREEYEVCQQLVDVHTELYYNA
jgi:hypothetical protein